MSLWILFGKGVSGNAPVYFKNGVVENGERSRLQRGPSTGMKTRFGKQIGFGESEFPDHSQRIGLENVVVDFVEVGVHDSRASSDFLTSVQRETCVCAQMFIVADECQVVCIME